MRALILTILTVGCGGLPADGPVRTGEQRPDGSGADATLTPSGQATLGTDDQQGRPWRRMDIDQLSASLQRVTGERWSEVDDGETFDLFDRLAGSLGKPDYLSSTTEDLTPGLLFQKFLDDAATESCTRMAAKGTHAFFAGLPSSLDPSADRAATEAVVARALLTFHGVRLTDDDERLKSWTWLVDSVFEQSGDPKKAWRTLCVGLATHPSFTLY